MNQEEKLKRFTATIEAEAQAECEKILDSIKQEMDSAMRAADDELLGDAFRHIKNQVASERTETGRRVSRHMMERKTALGVRREEMAAEVMEKVRARLAEYVKTDGYAKQLAATAKRVLAAFGNKETVIFLRAEDTPLVKKLTTSLKGEPVTFAEGSFEMGGLMATCSSTHMQIDESFDTKFGELRGHFAELFGLQLTQ
ncbi:hypothetical protein FACS18949_08390 [Clostridia bacterium]|nr:hypothetical protein FACS18949_08390 [Clostridia bacterium]